MAFIKEDMVAKSSKKNFLKKVLVNDQDIQWMHHSVGRSRARQPVWCFFSLHTNKSTIFLPKMDDTSPADQKFHEAFDVFLWDDTARSEDKASLLNYLGARPFFSKPIELTPINEVTERLDISRKIETRLQRKILTGLWRLLIWQSSWSCP